jgi:hypothetical protein
MYTSKKLVSLIETNADVLTRKWIELVRSHPGTPSYCRLADNELYMRAYRVYSQLGKWLSRDTTKADIAKQYVALGEQRHREGIHISEVIQALMITRRVLWFKVLDDGLLDNALDLRSAIDLNNDVVLFFDRAMYFAAVGYEQGKVESPELLTMPPKTAI